MKILPFVVNRFQWHVRVVFSEDLTREAPASVVATFITDGPMQNIIVDGPTDPGLSGFQVRNTTVPEPSGILLCGLSGIAFLLRRRK